MGVLRFIRVHVDTLIALALTALYLVEVWGAEAVVGEPYLSVIDLDETLAIAAGAAFML